MYSGLMSDLVFDPDYTDSHPPIFVSAPYYLKLSCTSSDMPPGVYCPSRFGVMIGFFDGDSGGL